MSRNLDSGLEIILLTNKGISKRIDIGDAIVNIINGRSFRIPRFSIGKKMQSVYFERGIDNAVVFYKKQKESNNHIYDLSDLELNGLAQQFAADNKLNEVIPVFQLIAENYPNAPSAFQALSRAYAAIGDSDLSMQMLNTANELPSRDHRKLGRELELFTFIANGSTSHLVWLPKGVKILDATYRWMRQQILKRGYEFVVSQQNITKNLESFAFTESIRDHSEGLNEATSIRWPGNNCCACHIGIYKIKSRSYNDLPIRFAELCNFYPHESNLNGETLISHITTVPEDHLHVFCKEETVKDELVRAIQFVQQVFSSLGFADLSLTFFTGTQAGDNGTHEDSTLWQMAEQAMEHAATESLLTWRVIKAAPKHGPTMVFNMRDALNRNWEIGRLFIDFQSPKENELQYIGPNHTNVRPFILHFFFTNRLDRLVAILIEHFAGNLPVWLTPQQCAILVVSEKFNEYAKGVSESLVQQGIRAYVDERNETVRRKIRDAESSKVPVMLIVGAKEADSRQVSVRKHGLGDVGTIDLDDFLIQYKSFFQQPE